MALSPTTTASSRPRPISPSYALSFGVALAALLLIALFPLFPGQNIPRVGDVASRTVTPTGS